MKKLWFRLRQAVKSPWFWLILAGYALRVLLMPITAQHDALFMPWMTHFMLDGHWNLYAYLYDTFGPGVIKGLFVWAPYPYGFYLYTAGWLWLWDRLHLLTLAGWEQVWGLPHVARQLFIAKLAYLPFELLIAAMMYRVGGRKTLALWAWSPLAFYTPFVMGQNDLYATALAALGVHVAARAVRTTRASRYIAISVLALGIGSCFKLYPLFLLPPLVLWMEARWERRALWLALGLTPLLLSILPFLRTTAFVEGVLFSPEGVHIFDTVSWFGVPVAPFVVSYGLLLAYPLFNRVRTEQGTWALSALVLLVFFLWVKGAFYWLIWLMPFIAILTAYRPKALWGWGALNLAWAALLPTRHSDLGAGLAKNVIPALNPVNLSTALALTHPDLYRMTINIVTPALNSLLLVGWVLLIWEAVQLLRESVASSAPVWMEGRSQTAQTSEAGEGHPVPWPERKLWRAGWLLLPAAALVLGLAINIGLARHLNLALFSVRYWEKFTLQSGQTLVQALPVEGGVPLNGLRLRIESTSAPVDVELCLLEAPDAEPLRCVTRSTAQLLDGVYLYALWEPITLPEGSAPYGRVRVLGEGAVTLRWGRGVAFDVRLDGAAADGAAELFPLTSLQATRVLRQARAALSDGVLITLQSLTLLGMAGFLSFLNVGRSEAGVADA